MTRRKKITIWEKGKGADSSCKQNLGFLILGIFYDEKKNFKSAVCNHCQRNRELKSPIENAYLNRKIFSQIATTEEIY